jgi:hypothetical protein
MSVDGVPRLLQVALACRARTAARWAAVGFCSPPDRTKSRRLPYLDGVAWRTAKLGPAKTSVAAATVRTARSSACLNVMLSPS